MAITKKAAAVQRARAFQQVFVDNAWGNRANAGKSYKRPYNKTTGKGKKEFLAAHTAEAA